MTHDITTIEPPTVWHKLKPGGPYDATLGAYVNGVALFEAEFGIVITGHMTMGITTQSREAAEQFAKDNGIEGATGKMSQAKFMMFVDQTEEA